MPCINNANENSILNKAVIFDLDGTLLDTAPDICAYVNIALEHFGYKKVTKSDIVKFIGNGARNLITRCLGEGVSEQTIDTVLAFYNNVYANSNSDYTVVFDGIIDLLFDLKKRGYKLIIMTNKPQRNTDDLYKKFFKNIGFDAVIGQSDSVKCKPDKTATINVLNKLNVLPENTYFIGDGETDVITSINAGTNGIAVLWGYRTKEQLSSAGATVFASHPSQLSSIISL